MWILCNRRYSLGVKRNWRNQLCVQLCLSGLLLWLKEKRRRINTALEEKERGPANHRQPFLLSSGPTMII
jgi:hypothetical protein